MIKATKNQLAIINNGYQTNAHRVLFACSVGLLRSPTAANEYHQLTGANTRACGVDKEYALIPISEALIRWADAIVYMESSHRDKLEADERDLIESLGIVEEVLMIPDEYDWNSPELVEELKHSFRSVRLI